MVQGHCPNEIAQQLFVSKRTVEYHLGHIYAKLGVNNRMGALQQAFRLGLCEPLESTDEMSDAYTAPTPAYTPVGAMSSLQE